MLEEVLIFLIAVMSWVAHDFVHKKIILKLEAASWWRYATVPGPALAVCWMLSATILPQNAIFPADSGETSQENFALILFCTSFLSGLVMAMLITEPRIKIRFENIIAYQGITYLFAAVLTLPIISISLLSYYWYANRNAPEFPPFGTKRDDYE